MRVEKPFEKADLQRAPSVEKPFDETFAAEAPLGQTEAAASAEPAQESFDFER